MEPTDSPAGDISRADELPKLASWLAEQRMAPAAFGQRVGLTREAVRKYCLPFGHPDRQVPGLAAMTRIVEATAAAVTPADFYPSELSVSSDGAAR